MLQNFILVPQPYALSLGNRGELPGVTSFYFPRARQPSTLSLTFRACQPRPPSSPTSPRYGLIRESLFVLQLSQFHVVNTPSHLMAEVQPRTSASRGRGSGRAGRGGHTSRSGGRTGARQSNGDQPTATSAASLEEQGEIGQLKKQYLSQLETLRELFPDWTDDDLVFAIEETDGDLPRTIERITEGTFASASLTSSVNLSFQICLLTRSLAPRKCLTVCRC